MRGKVSIIFMGILVAAAAFGAALPENTTQTEAQRQAALANEIGSDKSLKLSATTAMQAIIKFGENDVLGATSHAYKAYGKFKDSENLDITRKKNLLLKAGMGAPGKVNLTEGETKFLASSTSYRRLDPSFLTSGDDAKIAEEFEKKTGFKRGEFLDMLSTAAENKLYSEDPKLAEKVDAQWDTFADKIPNTEFREKVKKAVSIVPSVARQKFFVQAAQKMMQLAASATSPAGSDTMPFTITASTIAIEPKREPSAAEGAPVVAAAEDSDDEAINAPKIGALNSDAMARARAAAGDSNLLDSVVKAAVGVTHENETIFQIVSRKYKTVSSRVSAK